MSGRRFGTIPTALWGNPSFMRLTLTGRLVYLYALAGPHSNLSGVFRLPPAYVAADLGMTPDEVHQALFELETAGLASFADGWCLLPRAILDDSTSGWASVKTLRGAVSFIKIAIQSGAELNLTLLVPGLEYLQKLHPDDPDLICLLSATRGHLSTLEGVSVPHQSPSVSKGEERTVEERESRERGAQCAADMGKTGCFPLPIADAENKNPVRQEHDALSLEVAQISDPDLRTLDSPQMRAEWRRNPLQSETYTRFLIRKGVEGPHHTSKEKTA